MRGTITLLTTLALAFAAVALAPAAHAQDTACTDLVHPECDAFVCADTSLDGRYQWNECEPRYCTCDPQPEPW